MADPIINLTQEELKTLKTVLSLTGISMLAAACRTIMSKDERTFIGFVTRFILGIFVGMVLGFLASDYELPAGVQYAIVAGGAVTAREILGALVIAAETARDSVQEYTKKYMDSKFKEIIDDGKPKDK